MNIGSIISSAGLSARPSYYSGRGAISDDLDSFKLIKIQSLIKAHHGESAAIAFLKMVQSMSNMNATDFIQNCYTLEQNNFEWTIESPQVSGVDFVKDENCNHNQVQAVATLYSSIRRGNRDDTNEIKSGFLRANGIKPERNNSRYQWR
jgi:hypothetical protein